MRSPEREQWIDQAKPLTEKPENVQILTGLEALVSLPNTASSPPPKYKTAFVTWIGVFLCASVLGHFLAPYLIGLPYLLRQAIITGLVIILLAYVVMPRLTRLFHGWLHRSWRSPSATKPISSLPTPTKSKKLVNGELISNDLL